jgi:RNA recognition motif-containing protein
LSKVQDTSLPLPPADLNITTLFVGGLTEKITEDILQEVMAVYGKVAKIKMITK